MDNINDTIADAWEATLRGKTQLYKKAREMNPEITVKMVSDWWARNMPDKANYRGYNSFVANYPKEEYQADLFFLTSGADKDKLKRRSDIVQAKNASKPADGRVQHVHARGGNHRQEARYSTTWTTNPLRQDVRKAGCAIHRRRRGLSFQGFANMDEL